MKQILPTINGELFRRFLVVLMTALWFGGFTFYSGVVIHTGHQIYGSHREVGFLTQQVTNWLNLIGVATLLVLFWNTMAARGCAMIAVRRGLLLTWVVMAAIEAVLFILHPRVDGTLDAVARTIPHRAEFRSLHLWYMNLSTAQWGTAILHIWLMLTAWKQSDQTSDGVAPAPGV